MTPHDNVAKSLVTIKPDSQFHMYRVMVAGEEFYCTPSIREAEVEQTRLARVASIIVSLERSRKPSLRGVTNELAEKLTFRLHSLGLLNSKNIGKKIDREEEKAKTARAIEGFLEEQK